MKFGLPLVGLSPRYYAEIAKAAEECGFESVWVPDHLVVPATIPPTYPYTDTGMSMLEPSTPLFDPWVLLGAIASATSTIRLATGVLILPLRHPFITARAIVTLDRLSGGRVIVGVGMGWLREEFDECGESFDDRGRRGDEIIPLLRRLWADEVIEHHGEFYDFGPIMFQPKPVRELPPILIGGNSVPALRRVARHGDGWIEIGARSFDDVRADLASLRTMCADAGRDPAELDITISGSIARDADAIRRAEDLGVTRILVERGGAGGRGTAAVVEWMQQFSDQFISGASSRNGRGDGL